MTKQLFLQAISKFALGIVLVGLLIFLPAGTLHYFGGLLLMAVLFIPMLGAGIVMMRKAPDFLRKRISAKETEGEQQLVIKLSGLMFIVGFVIAGLSYRFGWLLLPRWVSILGAAILLVAYLGFAEVLRENAYLSRTIEVQEGQTVVSTGLYGIVRHPMYAASVFLFLAMPLVLGSVISLIIFLVYPFIIAKRIKNEEEVLEKGLDGYSEYKKRVKYRIIPFIW